jgi:hypothetical protein
MDLIERAVEVWINNLDPARMPPAPHPDDGGAQAINQRATEGHPCAHCGGSARCAYIGTRLKGREVPPFWLDLCPPCVLDVRSVLDKLAGLEEVQL